MVYSPRLIIMTEKDRPVLCYVNPKNTKGGICPNSCAGYLLNSGIIESFMIYENLGRKNLSLSPKTIARSGIIKDLIKQFKKSGKPLPDCIEYLEENKDNT